MSKLASTTSKRVSASGVLLARPLVICGPSGVGKGTLRALLRERYTGLFQESVSHTTRSARAGEVHGVDYWYVSNDEFASHSFLETFEFGPKKYGTSIAEMHRIRDSGAIPLFEVHYTSARKIREAVEAKFSEMISMPIIIFITTKNKERECRKRIVARSMAGDGHMPSEEDLEKRVEEAMNEFEFAESHAEFFDAIISNDDSIENAFAALMTTLRSHYSSELDEYESQCAHDNDAGRPLSVDKKHCEKDASCCAAEKSGDPEAQHDELGDAAPESEPVAIELCD
jgi:guanylate kinase